MLLNSSHDHAVCDAATIIAPLTSFFGGGIFGSRGANGQIYVNGLGLKKSRSSYRATNCRDARGGGASKNATTDSRR